MKRSISIAVGAWLLFIQSVLGVSHLAPPRPVPGNGGMRVPVQDIQRDLKILMNAPANTQLKLSEVQSKKLEESLDAIADKVLVQDGRQGRFEVHKDLSSRINSSENAHVNGILIGLSKALKNQDIKSVQKNADGTLKIQDGTTGQLRIKEPANVLRAGLTHPGTGSATVQWAWKWWGFKVRFSHKAAYYLCHYTTSILNQLPFPGWIEWLVKGVACVFHSLDGDSDGITFNVTWVGAFWFNDSGV